MSEDCDHSDREFRGVDTEGRPGTLWAEYHCPDCEARISEKYEPTGERIEQYPDGTSVEKGVRHG